MRYPLFAYLLSLLTATNSYASLPQLREEDSTIGSAQRHKVKNCIPSEPSDMEASDPHPQGQEKITLAEMLKLMKEIKARAQKAPEEE
jgi:DNA topoisomerase VI subunit B